MDEPFGAVDPIVRARLQDEFLRIQRQLGTTVLFVTHDIDEAIKMGSRVAVMATGGRLVQYSPPAELLAHPVDEHVAQFVGADRALKALALTRVGDLPMEAVPPPPQAPKLRRDVNARDALAQILASGSSVGALTDEQGTVVGGLSLASIVSLLQGWSDTEDSPESSESPSLS